MPATEYPVQVGPPAGKGEGRARRCFVSPDKLVTSPTEGVYVLADILKRSVEKFGSQQGLGWRGELVSSKATGAQCAPEASPY